MGWFHIEDNCKQCIYKDKVKWKQLNDFKLFPMVDNETAIKPFRLIPVAKWASKYRTPVALNGDGKILLFHFNKYLFEKSPKRWSPFVPETTVSKLTSNSSVYVSISEVQEAVYEDLPQTSLFLSNKHQESAMMHYKTDPPCKYKDIELTSSPSCPNCKILLFRKLFERKNDTSVFDRNIQEEIVTFNGASVLTIDEDKLAISAILLIKEDNISNTNPVTTNTFTESSIHIRIIKDSCLEHFTKNNKYALAYLQ